MGTSSCRFCQAPLRQVFADLGETPLANSYRSEQELGEMEPFYPLRAMVCEKCFLVQLGEYETPDMIFSEYAYFSSYSDSWLEHSRRYVDMAVERFGLDGEQPGGRGRVQRRLSAAVLRGAEVPVLGIEPAANVAEVAEAQRHPHRRQVLRPGDGARGGGDDARRPGGRQQRARPRPGPERLRRRVQAGAGAGGHGHGRVSPPDEADREERVRHDLPRALLLLLVPDRAARVRGPRVDALRRGGAADPRRLAADLRPPRRGRVASRSANAPRS